MNYKALAPYGIGFLSAVVFVLINSLFIEPDNADMDVAIKQVFALTLVASIGIMSLRYIPYSVPIKMRESIISGPPRFSPYSKNSLLR